MKSSATSAGTWGCTNWRLCRRSPAACRASREAKTEFFRGRQIEAVIRPRIYYDSQTALVCLENTHNMAGGMVYPTATVEDICEHAHAANLKVHMDGARIFNAAVALNDSVANMTRHVRFGDVLLVQRDWARRWARWWSARKRLLRRRAFTAKCLAAGCARQALLRRPGLVALRNSPSRLHIDHENAQFLAEGVAQIPQLSIDPAKVRTNIVICDCAEDRKDRGGILRRVFTRMASGRRTPRCIPCDL